MKLKFDPDLYHQRKAVDTVCDLFEQQDRGGSVFALEEATPSEHAIGDAILGNELLLETGLVLKNLQRIQEDAGLPVSERLESLDFTVEMETGTGKTYVYLRTAYELNKRYSFKKFIIVVPSIAIREGVAKSLRIMADHFSNLYAGQRPEFFVYDSAKMGRVRSFAHGDRMQIMIVTVGAINRQTARLYQPDDRTDGITPIELIRQCQPVVIVDEPQSVEGGRLGAGHRALREMNALCRLRYSATHADQHHMVYKLDPIEAYQQGLVKQIEVAAATVEDSHNRAHIKFIRIVPGAGIKAQIEVSIASTGGTRSERTTVIEDEDLEDVTGLAAYRGYRVGEITAAAGQECLEIICPEQPVFLRLGEATGAAEGSALQRHMIRRTIREHFDKELLLRPLGIKVLSLFFIDSVDRYRIYQDGGAVTPGEYARIFEEEYKRAVANPRYSTLFGSIEAQDPSVVHGGYFSLDRHHRWVDTAEGNDTGRQAAAEAYRLIMRDKERLLSLDEPLKFIFSHSALREGWDNPNVFQICVLRKMGTDRERRQTVGRGLRLAVDQSGSRVEDGANVLTVIANETYQEFVQGLQRDIEADIGYRFGVIDTAMFAGLRLPRADGALTAMSDQEAQRLVVALTERDYVDTGGKALPGLGKALEAGHVVLPAEFEPQRARITALLRKRVAGLRIDDADKKVRIKARPEALASPEFQALWPRIKRRTVYRVEFDVDGLVDDCVAAIRRAPRVSAPTVRFTAVQVGIGAGGVGADLVRGGTASAALADDIVPIPDILTELAERTRLTRRTAARILTEAAMWTELRRNPRAFVDNTVEIINDRKIRAITDGVRYRPLDSGEDYIQEQFEREELSAGPERVVEASDKCVYDHVIVESGPERRFAADLEADEAFALYTKLPRWFSVPTPLGPYHPDWAVVVRKDDDAGQARDHLYLVAETKSTLREGRLRGNEYAKAMCGREHFEALRVDATSAQFRMVTQASDLLAE